MHGGVRQTYLSSYHLDLPTGNICGQKVMHPKGLAEFILGTINPLTIGITAVNQWVYIFSCQS